ncbi:creatininase family protein [Neobacillus rhizophilus]|uniref:Creatininase family protein n=1 Tax=Neobacillus rhizophilus TaxID=2833579 RepID=A0A942U8A0_9BACI|nr:creatininase family protein [Neobacillus rhizophilus]MBS4214241.1 creatininase family protein [Neobacillus rhizophilus]MBU8915970.1 creatininase family protein [Bacillus sp. FJAT-29953]
MKSVWLQENKWEDVEHYLENKKTILVPFGSVEQHAKHLPMGTDSLVAIKVAEDAAAQTGTLVAPPTWVGWAPHHMAFPGTITLRPETLTNVAMDIIQSLVYHGFEKIILINGHREANLPPLKIAVTKLRNRTGAFIAIADPFYIAEQVGRRIRLSEAGGIGHAAEMETSHMYYIHPELCEEENAVKNVHQKHPFLQHDPYSGGDRVFVPSDVAAYREGSMNIGVVGDPTVSTKENGEIYHHELVGNIVNFIQYCEEEVQVTLRNQEIPL